MRQYEVTFIVDPVLPNDQIESTAKNYSEHLKKQNCQIVHVDHMGLRQLAYPISKRTSGVYFSIEFQSDSLDVIDNLELALRRDERVIRFLTVKLDKYGVKYNDDKRNGRIGTRKKQEEALTEEVAASKADASKAAAPAVAAAAPAATETAPAAPETSTESSSSEEE